MPRPPADLDEFDKVNFVIDAWTTGCDAPWYVYVETMKPAALKAFITLITFGMGDVIRGYYRPKGLDRRRTGKRKGRWARYRPGFPELGNTLGKQLPGATEIKGAHWNNKLKFLWRVDTRMQFVLFWWLVADVTIDFAFDWTSLLYESYWCQKPQQGRFSYRVTNYFVISDNNWKQAGLTILDYEVAPPSWFGLTGITGGNPANVTAAMTIKKHPSFPPPTSFSVRVQAVGGGTVYSETTNDAIEPSGDASLPVYGVVPPFTAFEVRGFMEGTPFALWGDGVVVGWELLP